MLKGNIVTKEITSDQTALVIQLLLQQRYAEVYQLLIAQEQKSNSIHYNTALCLHWAENFHGAINHLNRIQQPPTISSMRNMIADSEYQAIRNLQNQTSDHLQGMSEEYINQFPELFNDQVARLLTDCWLKLGNFPEVIRTANPIQHKGYKNITEALNIAKSAND